MLTQCAPYLPNLITLVRAASMPIIVALLSANWVWWALYIYAPAAATDRLDGMMARWLQSRNIEVHPGGQTLDAKMDKVFVGGVILGLLWVGFILTWLTVLLVGILVLRECVAWVLRSAVRLPASRAAQLKTATQMFALGFLMLNGVHQSDGTFFADTLMWVAPWAYPIGNALLVIAVALSLWSMRVYLTKENRQSVAQRYAWLRFLAPST